MNVRLPLVALYTQVYIYEIEHCRRERRISIMNRLYRLVWNARQNAWIAAPESAKGRSKGGGGKRLLAVMLLTPGIALAAPTGGTVTSGTATINQNGAVTNVVQGSQKASINWQGFSVSANETVNFNQPNRSAIALNRVIGNERSVIDGALNANGQVFLVNSNGVLLGKGSSVNVGGLVASTRDISDADFNAGRYQFKGESGGAVINLGTLRAGDGGYIVLLGKHVSNQGVIAATKGTVALSAGDKITLDFNGDSLIRVTLDQGTLDALVENQQAILADGGTVYLSAKAADEVLGAQVNNSGIVRARTIDDLSGRIELYAHGGTTNVDGTLDASAPTAGDGGFVETSGQVVNVADSAFVTTRAGNGRTGLWLIDPNDFTVAASGGNMTGEAVSNALANNDFSIDTHTMGAPGHGDIHVNDRITWSSDNTLTLTAERDIHINNAIATDGANAELVLNYGGDYDIRTKASYSGTTLDANGKPVAKQDTSGGIYGSVTFTNDGNTDGLTINGNRYALIHSMADFDKINQADGVGDYALAQNLDAAGTTYTAEIVTKLDGTLAGLGHVVDRLTVDATGNAGLIGMVGSGNVLIRDIGVAAADITSSASSAGALVANATGRQITVKNTYSTGNVKGLSNTGGLIGLLDTTSNLNTPSIIANSFSSANVSSSSANPFSANTLIGGLVGMVNGNVQISDVHASGNISGGSAYMGGLIGYFYGGYSNTNPANLPSLTNAYATGKITHHATSLGNYDSIRVGGLIGQAGSSVPSTKISNSFATGEVTAYRYAGGLVGEITNAVLDNTYATGKVTATGTGPASGGYTASGGLVGRNNYSNIYNSFATGDVYSTVASGGGSIGGLVGHMASGGVIDHSYATGNVHGGSSGSVGGLVGAFKSGPTHSGVISNSYAKGNVSGAGGVGGLVGNQGIYSGMTFESSRNAIIENSQAYGNVTGTSDGVGGLVGWAENHGYSYQDADGNIVHAYVQGNIYNSQAYGNVTGNDYVGGVVGRGANVIGSSSSGVITGNDFVGGIAGLAHIIQNSHTSSVINASGPNAGAIGGYVHSDSENNYYRADNGGVHNGYGQVSDGWNNVVIDDAIALSNEEYSDVEHYLDGTINQVLADRAAAKAAVEAAERAELAFRAAASAVAGNEVGQALCDQPRPDAFADLSTRSPAAVALDQNVVIAPPKHYGADVRSIEVDGKTFMLEDEDKNKKKPRAVQPE
jgi:filamentous hemagglutinin family protein